MQKSSIQAGNIQEVGWSLVVRLKDVSAWNIDKIQPFERMLFLLKLVIN
jgi:hypothetical protein